MRDNETTTDIEHSYIPMIGIRVIHIDGSNRTDVHRKTLSDANLASSIRVGASIQEQLHHLQTTIHT